MFLAVGSWRARFFLGSRFSGIGGKGETLVEVQAVSESQSKNLICNFRAPNLEHYQRWKAYVQWAKDNGMDVCHLTLGLTDAFM
jgi:hypothetical protein